MVKEDIAELVKMDTFIGNSELDYEAALNRKAKINTMLRESVDGKDSAKDIVLDLIYGIVTKHCRTESMANGIIAFNSPRLDVGIKFEILMYHYKKYLVQENAQKPLEQQIRDPGKDAIKIWVKKYDLNREKHIIEDGVLGSYCITADEVH